MSEFDKWLPNQKYNKQDLVGLYTNNKSHKETDSPFTIDSFEESCLLKCDDTYWSNTKSKNYPSSSAFDQRCTSNNCKVFDNDKQIHTKTQLFKPCKDCWDQSDLSWNSDKNSLDIYDKWDGKASYTWEELKGRNT